AGCGGRRGGWSRCAATPASSTRHWSGATAPPATGTRRGACASTNCCASRALPRPAGGPGSCLPRRPDRTAREPPLPLGRGRRAGGGRDARQRAAVLLWAVALVLLGGKALLWPHRHSVYPIFADAGRNWREAADLYHAPDGREPYRYSPLVAAFFVPF